MPRSWPSAEECPAPSKASNKRAAPSSASPYPITPSHPRLFSPFHLPAWVEGGEGRHCPAPGALMGTGGAAGASPQDVAGPTALPSLLALLRIWASLRAQAPGSCPGPLSGVSFPPFGLPHAPVPAPSAPGVLLGGNGAEGTGFPGWGRGSGGQNGTALQALSCFFVVILIFFPFNTDAALT